MKSKHKINSSLFSSLNENIKNPFLVLDHSGEILSINKEAETIFPFKPDTAGIFDLFDEKSGSKLNDIIEEVFVSNKPIIKSIHLKLKDGSDLSTQVIINSYKEEDEFFIFCTFRPHEHKIDLKGITNYKVIFGSVNDLINNKEIPKILDDIKSLYPFTFIGKERILKKVNNLDDLFWIKDINGIYILVNNKFASGLGLKASQIEGKSTDSFVPSYIIEFRNAVENYIKKSINCIVIEGAPILGLAASDEYQTIEIPLVDADNNVIAIIGIGQKADKQAQKTKEEDLFDFSFNILVNFPKAVAFVDGQGIIKQSSREFCKLFSDEFSDLRNFYYTKVVPIKLYEKIRQFLDSPDEKETFELSIQSGAKNNQDKIITLSKIFGKENTEAGFSIIIEDSLLEENLEQLILNRGRMFEILIENNPEPIFIYDTENLRFIEVNEAALSLYGYRKDEFLQMDLTDLYTPEDIQTLLDSSNASAREGKFSGPFKHKKKDGSYVFVEISKINFKFNEKDAHFNIIRDVTEKLENDKKNQLFKSAFDNTGELLFITDSTGFITYINMPVKNILGFSKADLENTLFSALVKSEDRGTINSSVFQSHLKEPVTIATEIKKQDGEYIECELTASPVLNYKQEVETFCIIGKVKVKESVEKEEIIKEVIKEVIVEKPSTATGKPSEPVDLNLLSSLFHELLTPINVILGFVQELTEGIENPTSEQKEATEIINQNRDRLLNTMNSVVEYANIQKNEIELKPREVGITEIIDKLHNDFREIAGTDDFEFAYGKISSSLRFETDKARFQNLMYQLVKIVTRLNKGKKIYFSAYQMSEDEFIISVKDNYSSVSSYLFEYLKSIFQNLDEEVSGEFGVPKLTLRLAKSLIKLLNGRFEILDQRIDKADYGFVFPLAFHRREEIIEEAKESLREEVLEPADEETDELSEIPPVEEKIAEEPQPEEEKEIELPLEEEIEPEKIIIDLSREKHKTVERTVRKLDINKLSCLYIEDQVDSQILFKVQMKELKDIKFAVSFEEALPLLDSCHFDFIVMDINLQGEYNGLDALKIIHRMPGYEKMPIIAVTAYVLPGDKEKFIATGFHDFISKPIFKEKMIDSLEKIFLSTI